MTDDDATASTGNSKGGKGQDFNDALQSGGDSAKEIATLIAGPGDPPVDDVPVAPRALGFDVEAINKNHAIVVWGSKSVVVKHQTAGPFTDRLRIMSVEAFNIWYANRHTEFVGQDGRIKTTTWAKAWIAHRQRRQYAGVEFFPSGDGEIGTPDYLNLWEGFDVKPSPDGDYSIFRDHLSVNVCDGNPELFAFVFGWFAHLFQKPRERIGTAIVLRGRMGVGKSKVGEVFGRIIPGHYFQVDDPRYIVGNFNAHMARCLLLQAEEAVWAGDKHAEGRIKGLITSETQMVEQKGLDPIKFPNFIRLLMTSNEDWVVPAGKDERRFCVLDVNPRCAQNHEYFSEMESELQNGGLARLLYDLLCFDLATVNLRAIPMTEALLEQKFRSFDPVDSWWVQRLKEGSPIRSMDNWPGEIATGALYEDYLSASNLTGIGRKRDQSTFGHKLKKLIPNLEKMRPRATGGKREYVYALPPLDRCREAFDMLLGQQIEWPDCLAGEGDTDFSDEVPQ